MFWPDVIFRYIRIHSYLFVFLLLPPQSPVFTHWDALLCKVLNDALCCGTFLLACPFLPISCLTYANVCVSPVGFSLYSCMLFLFGVRVRRVLFCPCGLCQLRDDTA
jgi:hypothetical protein